MQRLHGFLHGSVCIQAMNLIEIHIVKSQTREAMVDLRHDILAGGAAAVGTAGAHLKVHLCCHYDFITVQPKVLDVASRDFLTGSHLVDIRRVKVIDTKVNGLLENLLAILIGFRPREYAVFLAGFAKAHHAKADQRNIHTRVAKLYILHFSFLLFCKHQYFS